MEAGFFDSGDTIPGIRGGGVYYQACQAGFPAIFLFFGGYGNYSSGKFSPGANGYADCHKPGHYFHGGSSEYTGGYSSGSFEIFFCIAGQVKLCANLRVSLCFL